MKQIYLLLLIISLANCSALTKNKAEFLFVQSGKVANYDGRVLRISQAAKNTIYFSDRPQRLAGRLSNADFFKIWNGAKQKNSFKKDPPNLAISYYDLNGKPRVAIVEAVSLKNSNQEISYEVKILQGKLMKNMKEITLFIDGALLQDRIISLNGLNSIMGRALIIHGDGQQSLTRVEQGVI